MYKAMTLRDVINHVEDNFHTGMVIDDITKYSGYSRRHIQDLLKQQVGMPIGCYIKKRRITRASFLLRLTRTSIIDISLKLGFDSQQSFCREFKKATGYTPLKYRKKETWDLSPVYCGLSLATVSINSLQYCTLPRGTVAGNLYYNIVPIPQPHECYASRLKIILDKLARDKKDIVALSEFTPHDNSINCLKVKSVIGLIDDINDSSYNSSAYPAGTYACFSFKFNPQKYATYSQYIYCCLMPLHKLTRRAGSDIEIFHYPSSGEFSGMIQCTYYIPIAPPTLQEVVPFPGLKRINP